MGVHHVDVVQAGDDFIGCVGDQRRLQILQPEQKRDAKQGDKVKARPRAKADTSEVASGVA